MTTKKFQLLFAAFIGLCIVIILLAVFSFDFIEINRASDWTLEYFTLPILIAMIPTCWYLYFRFIREQETKEYDLILWTRLRSAFRIFLFSLGMTAMLFATTLSLIILTNAMGKSQAIILKAKVIEYRAVNGRGGTKHYIKIEDSQLNRVVELKVNESYEVGEPFNKEMKIGIWGLLYSED